MPEGSNRAYLRGVAFWSPLLPGWEVAAAAFRGEASLQDPPAARPAPSLLPPTERRRAPDTVALALEVAARACASAGLEASSLPSVFASALGDIAISDYMGSTIAKSPTLVSPIRFHNSVHNAAAGYWTIGTGCSEPYTAVSACEATFGAGLLEALTQAACLDRPVLLAAYDIEARGPLAGVVASVGLLAAGLVVAPGPGPDSACPVIDWHLQPGTDPTPTCSPTAQALLHNGMSGCLPLYEALAWATPAKVRLPVQRSMQLELSLAWPG